MCDDRVCLRVTALVFPMQRATSVTNNTMQRATLVTNNSMQRLYLSTRLVKAFVPVVSSFFNALSLGFATPPIWGDVGGEKLFRAKKVWDPDRFKNCLAGAANWHSVGGHNYIGHNCMLLGPATTKGHAVGGVSVESTTARVLLAQQYSFMRITWRS